MKFALITDIHGNASALEAVLAILHRDQEIETIYCLGDLVGIGAQTNEVIDLIRRVELPPPTLRLEVEDS